MYQDLIPPLIFLLFLTFILVVPVLLWRGFRKIADPVPCWLPVVPVVVILLAMAGLITSGFLGRGSSMAGTVIMFSLMLLLTTLAVVTPYLWFGNKTGITRPWGIFSLLSFLGVFMMFWSTMGESREGGPLPGFSLLLPLTGWIFDSPGCCSRPEGYHILGSLTDTHPSPLVRPLPGSAHRCRTILCVDELPAPCKERIKKQFRDFQKQNFLMHGGEHT